MCEASLLRTQVQFDVDGTWEWVHRRDVTVQAQLEESSDDDLQVCACERALYCHAHCAGGVSEEIERLQ